MSTITKKRKPSPSYEELILTCIWYAKHSHLERTVHHPKRTPPKTKNHKLEKKTNTKKEIKKIKLHKAKHVQPKRVSEKKQKKADTSARITVRESNICIQRTFI